MAHPTDRLYARTHEWVLIAGDVATVGISHFAQAELGDVVFVELPAVGRKFTAGESLGNIESVKAVSEVFTPVAGEVIEANGELEAHPEVINQDPHGAGWLIRMRVAPGAGAGLMDQPAYELFLAAEGAH